MLKDIYKKMMDIVFVNFLWFLTSLLGIGITLGASTTALFHVMHKITTYDEPTSVLRDYFKSFKENVVFSTLVWLLLVLLAVPMYFMYIHALSSSSAIFMVLSIVGFYQITVFFSFFFPTLAVFKTDNKMQLVKNVVIMSNTNIWTNIKVIGSLVFVVILVLYVHIVLIIIAPGVFGILVMFHLKKVFAPHIEKLLPKLEKEEIL